MNPPFTVEAFFGVFSAYNHAVWPAQLALLLLALAALVLVVRSTPGPGRAVLAILALLWAWVGVAYHMAHFTAINPPAWVFGGLFVVQAVFFAVEAYRGRIRFGRSLDASGWVAGLFLLYALVIYPLIGLAQGHAYMASPTFGAPCPTTIFTFGVLLLASVRVPGYLLAIPLLWSLVGMSAALSLGVYQDLGLVVAGVTSTVMLLVRNRKLRAAPGDEPTTAPSPS